MAPTLDPSGALTPDHSIFDHGFRVHSHTAGGVAVPEIVRGGVVRSSLSSLYNDDKRFEPRVQLIIFINIFNFM